VVLDKLDGLRFSEDLSLIQRFMTQFRELGGWAMGDRSTLLLTEAELASFHAEYAPYSMIRYNPGPRYQ
jgi:hypothetical protein